MRKQTMKLTEAQLSQIISESIRRTINEAQKGNTYQELQNILQTLSNIRNSGFIPFASPSPSSTEKKLADAITDAANNIEAALYYCEQLGYN